MNLKSIRKSLRPSCPVIDIHVHPLRDFGEQPVASPAEDAKLHLAAADRAGVTCVCVMSLSSPPQAYPTPEQLREANDWSLAMRDAAPERILPFCYVSPEHPAESVKEIDRCVGKHRAVGIKLWIARRASDPALDPILEKAVEYGVPVLQHAWSKTTGNEKDESFPKDVADLARRHPSAKIIMAHLNGCGLRGIEDVRATPNVCVEVSGGDPEANIVEKAVERLGVERVLYGSDCPVRHYAVCIGKVMGARLSQEQHKMILFKNALRLLPEGVFPQTAAACTGNTAMSNEKRKPPAHHEVLCVDVNAYAGHWPSHPVHGDICEVVASLKAVGVDRICVSPLDAVWCRNQHHYNTWLLQVTRALPEVIPVPVIDPSLATWQSELETVAQDARVRMIKFHPAYSGYDLSDAQECLEAAGECGVAVQIQTRMEDPRRQHPLQQVPDVPLKAIMDIAERHRAVRILTGGPRWTEVQAERDRLLALPNAFVDVSQCDGMDTVRRLCDLGLEDKILFGSHAPLFIPWSAAARVVTDIDAKTAAKVLGMNAAGVLQL